MFREDETRAARERLEVLAAEGRARRGEPRPRRTEEKLRERMGLAPGEPSEWRPRTFMLVGALVLGGLGALLGSSLGQPALGLALGVVLALGGLELFDRSVAGSAALARDEARLHARLEGERARLRRLPFEVRGLEELLSSRGHVVSPTLRVELLEPARSLEPTLLSDLLGLVDEEGQQSSEVLVEGERLTIVGHPLDHRDRLYRWARAALERVLVPLHERHPVAHVEVTGFVSEIEP